MKEDRSLLTLIVLDIITIGIYGLFFWHGYAKDMNIVCAGDGRKTSGILAQVVFSLLTFGIYGMIWIYQAGDRIFLNCAKKNIPNNVSGGSILLWWILGTCIIIGPFIALYQMISGLNQLCIEYNKSIQDQDDDMTPVHHDTLSDKIPALDDIGDETQTHEAGSVTEIIRRGFDALEHSDFDDAKTFFNRALSHDSENPAVYIGLLMSKYRVKRINELVNIPALIDNDSMFRKALEYSNPELRKKLTRYVQVNVIKMRLAETH